MEYGDWRRGIWDVGRRLAYQLEVARRGIVVQAAGDETFLIETLCVGDDFSKNLSMSSR